MVSSTLNVGLQQLLETLARFRSEFADDPEYQELRKVFPTDWPM